MKSLINPSESVISQFHSPFDVGTKILSFFVSLIRDHKLNAAFHRRDCIINGVDILDGASYKAVLDF